MSYHRPVLLEESIEGLCVKSDGLFVDATFGGGGHSKEILKKLNNGKLFCFDQDEDTLANVPDDNRIVFINENFKFMKNFLRLYNAIPVDGILADLGVSSFQLDEAEKGFSTRFDGPLDMRMNKKNKLSAGKIINTWSQEQLREMLYLFGELKNANRIAGEIVKARKENTIETTSELVNALKHLVPRTMENKFLARIFQALRIQVNDELDCLKELLIQSVDVLKTGGRLVVISYHSLEDRIVKNFMKSGNFTGNINKDFYGNVISPIKQIGKLITPGMEEIKNNNRARSAKLRIAEKI